MISIRGAGVEELLRFASVGLRLLRAAVGDPRRGGPDEQAALPVESRVLQDVDAPGSDPSARAARRARAFGGRDAAGGRDRAGEPVATVGGAAPGGAGGSPQGGLDCALLPHEPGDCRVAGGGPENSDVGAGRSGRVAGGPAESPPSGDRVDGTASLSWAIPLPHLWRSA